MKAVVNGIRLTPREAETYEALSVDPEWPGVIARRAGFRSSSMSEAGARYCIALTKKGLAQKHGARMFPKWSRVAPTAAGDGP